MKLSFKKTLSLMFLTSLLVILSGCGSGDNVPNPPEAESTLVVELFKALKDNDYTLATQKIKKLRMLDEDDYSLASIEYQIELDSGFYGAQELVDAGKVKEAKKLIKDTMSTYGRKEQLANAEVKVKKLEELQRIIDKIRKAKISSNIAIATGELNRYIATNKFAKPLIPFAEYSLDRARRLMTTEDKMAVRDLKADIDIAGVTDDSGLGTMMAELSIEDGQDALVSSYERSMAKNWKTANDDSYIIKLTDEMLYFRRALASNIRTREKIFSKLLVLPPGSFTSMLMRAFILEKMGYPAEADALGEIIIKALQLEKYKTIGWLKVRPDDLTGFNSINPFVLYPFFVYFEQK
jgi:hypothetical protein